MVLKSNTSVRSHGNGKAIYLPQELSKDSSFPFNEKESEDLIIEIRGKELVVRVRGKNETI